MNTICLIVPLSKKVWFTANSRLHWSEKARRTQHMRKVAYVLGASRINAEKLPHPVFARAHLTAVVRFSRNGRHDPGNASPVVKALIDGLTDAGYWVDDDSTRVIGPDYRIGQPTGKAGSYEVELVLEEVS